MEQALFDYWIRTAKSACFSPMSGLPGGMNGRQLAEQALRRQPRLKVLYTTGYARNAIVHQGRLDPGVEVIFKPFTYSDLATKIRRVLDD